jgi:hypothetical protein
LRNKVATRLALKGVREAVGVAVPDWKAVEGELSGFQDASRF